MVLKSTLELTYWLLKINRLLLEHLKYSVYYQTNGVEAQVTSKHQPTPRVLHQWRLLVTAAMLGGWKHAGTRTRQTQRTRSNMTVFPAGGVWIIRFQYTAYMCTHARIHYFTVSSTYSYCHGGRYIMHWCNMVTWIQWLPVAFSLPATKPCNWCRWGMCGGRSTGDGWGWGDAFRRWG